MNGRAFFDIARVALEDPDEAWQRTAAGRVYFALFLECRDALERWGFGIGPVYQAHAAVRNRLNASNHSELKHLGDLLRDLLLLRARADYQTSSTFVSSFQVEEALGQAEEGISVIDEIDNDGSKRAAAIAALQGVP